MEIVNVFAMKGHELQLLLSEGAKHQVLDAPEPSGPRIQKVRRIFSGMAPGRVILDVGCSNGGVLRPLVKTHEIHGVEIAPSYVARAVENGVHAVEHNIENAPLPYPAGKFDAIFCGETIEHQVDTDWLMFEINRVLKPGGKLVLTFPNIRTLLGVGMMLFFDLPPMYAARYRSAHFRDFTLRTVKIVLKAHGFKFESAVGSAFYLPRIGEFWSPLASVLPSWSCTVVVVATKQTDSIYSSESVIPTGLY
jgi:SAM-dependent methyltransferase